MKTFEELWKECSGVMGNRATAEYIYNKTTKLPEGEITQAHAMHLCQKNDRIERLVNIPYEFKPFFIERWISQKDFQPIMEINNEFLGSLTKVRYRKTGLEAFEDSLNLLMGRTKLYCAKDILELAKKHLTDKVESCQ